MKREGKRILCHESAACSCHLDKVLTTVHVIMAVYGSKNIRCGFTFYLMDSFRQAFR